MTGKIDMANKPRDFVPRGNLAETPILEERGRIECRLDGDSGAEADTERGLHSIEAPQRGTGYVALTTVDRALLQRCLKHEVGAWNDFVDRFLGLIYHAVHHTAHLRSVPLSPEDVEDVVAEVLLQIIASDYAILRHFRGQSSLGTYLTVIARRSCIHELTRRAAAHEAHARNNHRRARAEREEPPKAQVGLESLEEVQKILRKLPAREREVVRLFYLEGRSYEEISSQLRLPVNSIGPILSRARRKLRKDVKTTPSGRPHEPKPSSPAAGDSAAPLPPGAHHEAQLTPEPGS